MSGILINECSMVELAQELLDRCETALEANRPNGTVEDLQENLETYLKARIPCGECCGEGEVPDPRPCPRCHYRGCRSISCPKCNGAGYQKGEMANPEGDI